MGLTPKEKAVAKVKSKLTTYCKIRGYKLYTDIKLALSGKEAVYDVMVLGNFGILIFTCYGENGEYYGEEKDKNWTFIKKVHGKEVKSYIENPIQSAASGVMLLRDILGKENIYKITTLDNYVVFTNNSEKRQSVLAPQKLGYLRLKEVSPLLHKDRYEYDKGISVEKIQAAIEKYRVDK